jgi:hypothetical protein
MTTAIHVRAKITPWDDAAFVKAFEHALQAAEDQGIPDDAAGPDVQRLLRDGGYPDACVIVTRTVKDALEHSASWLVCRDG